MLAADGEKKRRLKAEAELRRVQQQLSFRVGEVQHLKTGLRSRDCELQDLRDRLREYELAEGGERTAQEAVAQAQGEPGHWQVRPGRCSNHSLSPSASCPATLHG